MSDQILKQLLKEYEIKRVQAENDLELKKKDLYSSYPELDQINQALNNYAISISKEIIKNNIENAQKLKFEFEKLKVKKENYIKKLNLPKDFFKPNYNCDVCNDTGYITASSKTILCNCIKQKLYDLKYNTSNMGDLEKENFSMFNFDLYSAEINKEKYKSNISPRENIKIIKNIAEKFIENFDDPNEKNLLFLGNTGLGKTFLSNCITNELIKKDKIILYQSATTMLDSIIDYKFGKNNSAENIYNNILNVDLLIIDDLGTENINPLKFAELFNILNTRLLNQNNRITKTIISTNLTMENIFKNYDERIVSRLVGSYNICRFFGDDIRFLKK